MRTACTRVDQLFVRISCPIEGKSGTMPIYELKEQQNDPGIYIIIHTLISLIAIVTSLVVVFGMLAGHQLDAWTKWFLITAVATTITGFFFPFRGFTRLSVWGLSRCLFSRRPSLPVTRSISQVPGGGSTRLVRSSVFISIFLS